VQYTPNIRAVPHVNLSCTHTTIFVVRAQAGLIDEMMDETFELDDIEDIDSLADEEVEKVFLEVTAGVMDKAAPAGRTALPQPEPEPEPEPEPIPRVSELDASLEARLLAL